MRGTSRELARGSVRPHDPGSVAGGVRRTLSLTCVPGIAVDSSAGPAKTEPPGAGRHAAHSPVPFAGAHSLLAVARSPSPGAVFLALLDRIAPWSGAVPAPTL